jgi:hypothetical protein
MQRRTMLSLATASLAAGLARPAEAALGQSLFNGRNLAGWDQIGDADWRVTKGLLVADRGNGMLVSQKAYGDFRLIAEFWADTIVNSGIFIRATNPATINAGNAYEVNIWDQRPDPTYGTGAIVDVAKVAPMPKAANRWNTYDITAKGDSFTVVLNGQKTVDSARDAKHASGRIALQHGTGLKDAQGIPIDTGVIKFRKLVLQAL